MSDAHVSRNNELPLQVKEYLETSYGKAFVKKQARRANLITILLYYVFTMGILFIVAKIGFRSSSGKDLNFLCLYAGLVLTSLSANVLPHQIVLDKLMHQVNLPREQWIRLPFQTPKVLIITVLGILLLIIGMLVR